MVLVAQVVQVVAIAVQAQQVKAIMVVQQLHFPQEAVVLVQ
jgi:hypothetical protein